MTLIDWYIVIKSSVPSSGLKMSLVRLLQCALALQPVTVVDVDSIVDLQEWIGYAGTCSYVCPQTWLN